MAKQIKNVPSLVDSFKRFKEDKKIDAKTMLDILEDILRSMLRRKYTTDENCGIILNAETGDIEIWRTRKVVADGFSENDALELELPTAQQLDPDLSLGDEAIELINLSEFGRREVKQALQTLQSRALDLAKKETFGKYKDRIGELFIGEVHQVWSREVLLLDNDGNELILPKTERIPADFFKKGDTVRAVIAKVEMQNSKVEITLSRTSPEFLRVLITSEVPEVSDGIITIKKIVREPGERAKVAVESSDDRVDPVGSCVGMKGSRIHGIVKELRNENIDIINYTENTDLYIRRALSPAKITSIEIDEENKTVSVYVNVDQVALAIGKSGNNIKLAGKLTGYEIDVYRDDQDNDDDVELEEFSDEIDTWVIEEFKRIGCDTAKSVLMLPPDELVKRTDLEEETVSKVLAVLRAEFE